MSFEHTLSKEIQELIQLAIDRNQNWMAYNNSLYFLGKQDVHFFKDKESALCFSESNYSDFDQFQIIHVQSIHDVFKRIAYEHTTMEKQQVNPDVNGLHNNEGNDFTDALIDHLEQQEIINNSKTNFMNEQNLQYLKDNIKYMGFGEKMGEQLEANLKQGNPEFILSSKTEVNKKPFEVSLNFRKSDSSDIYFFNSYHASMTRSNGEKVDQTFYLNKGRGVTAKEAFNLLEGRAVYKELNNKAGEPYKAWIQLDFENKDRNNNNEVKQFHDNYGYDLKAAVSKLAISELSDPEKEKSLLQSLQKGNLQSVTIEKDGSIHKMFVEANPQFKAITLYDGQLSRIQQQDLNQYRSLDQSVKKEIANDQKSDLKNDKNKEVKQKGPDDMPGQKNKTSRKKGVSL